MPAVSLSLSPFLLDPQWKSEIFSLRLLWQAGRSQWKSRTSINPRRSAIDGGGCPTIARLPCTAFTALSCVILPCAGRRIFFAAEGVFTDSRWVCFNCTSMCTGPRLTTPFCDKYCLTSKKRRISSDNLRTLRVLKVRLTLVSITRLLCTLVPT